MAIVMFYGDDPQFVLSGIERDEAGAVRKAEVVNGAWTLVITEAEHQSKSGNSIVHRWPKPSDVREVEVPDGGDYNEIMARAMML